MMLELSIIPTMAFQTCTGGGLKTPKIFGCNYYAMKSWFTLNDIYIYTSKAKTFSSK